MSGVQDDGTRAASTGGETQAAKSVSDELEGKAIT
jgi:hypothetical protein